MHVLKPLSDTGVTAGGLSLTGLAVSVLLHGGLLAAAAWLSLAGHPPAGTAGPRVMEVTYISLPAPEVAEPLQAEPPQAESPMPEAARNVQPVAKIAEDAIRQVKKPEQKIAPKPQPEPPRQLAGAGGAAARGAGQGAAVKSGVALRESYTDKLMRHIAAHRQYPLIARKRREEGVAVLHFALDGEGRLTSLHLLEGTGHRNLDRAALQTLRAAQPYPPPPAQLADTGNGFTIPVRFSLTN